MKVKTIPLPHLTLSTTTLTCEGFFKLLRDAEEDNGGVKTSSTWDISKIINTCVGGDVVSLISGFPGAADQLQLFSENINEGFIDPHLMQAVTDALAVCDLFTKIDLAFGNNDLTLRMAA